MCLAIVLKTPSKFSRPITVDDNEGQERDEGLGTAQGIDDVIGICFFTGRKNLQNISKCQTGFLEGKTSQVS